MGRGGGFTNLFPTSPKFPASKGPPGMLKQIWVQPGKARSDLNFFGERRQNFLEKGKNQKGVFECFGDSTPFFWLSNCPVGFGVSAFCSQVPVGSNLATGWTPHFLTPKVGPPLRGGGLYETPDWEDESFPAWDVGDFFLIALYGWCCPHLRVLSGALP